MSDKKERYKKYAELKGTYTSLTGNFWNGTFKGQLVSVFTAKDKTPQKVEDFHMAIREGLITIPEKLTPKQVRMLKELNILTETSVPTEEVAPQKKSPKKAENTPDKLPVEEPEKLREIPLKDGTKIPVTRVDNANITVEKSERNEIPLKISPRSILQTKPPIEGRED